MLSSEWHAEWGMACRMGNGMSNVVAAAGGGKEARRRLPSDSCERYLFNHQPGRLGWSPLGRGP